MTDYYKTPPQEIFEDIKENAIKIWQTYDNTYGYQDEKTIIDQEIAKIILEIKESGDTTNGQLIEAFRAGVKWCRENINDNSR